MSEYFSGVPYKEPDKSFDYTEEIYNAIDGYLKSIEQTKKLNKSLRKLGMEENSMPSSYFDNRLTCLNQKDFKKYYSRKKVFGAPTWAAYKLLTGKKYKFRVFKILLVLFKISIGLALILASYYLIKISFPFLKKEWKWSIPVILGFIYFSINLIIKLKK